MDNDYSAYEKLYETLTGTKLLDVNAHAPLADNTPSVTVIIPCYNTNGTIARVLSAIASQKLPEDVLNNIEVILVDDNSREPVAKAVEGASYPFSVEILRLESNHGVSNARMLGVT